MTYTEDLGHEGEHERGAVQGAPRVGPGLSAGLLQRPRRVRGGSRRRVAGVCAGARGDPGGERFPHAAEPGVPAGAVDRAGERRDPVPGTTGHVPAGHAAGRLAQPATGAVHLPGYQRAGLAAHPVVDGEPAGELARARSPDLPGAHHGYRGDRQRPGAALPLRTAPVAGQPAQQGRGTDPGAAGANPPPLPVQQHEHHRRPDPRPAGNRGAGGGGPCRPVSGQSAGQPQPGAPVGGAGHLPPLRTH